ncbi:MAG TPA: peroxiredoxin [Candidatus Absconditabacterales bacterium]|nr:peroxiredoxin [Candidatus Absconditabacterales bacterium]
MENLTNYERYPVKLEDKVEDLKLDIYDPKTDSIVEKNIKDYQGKRLVLFFYPADFTFVCPTELKDLNNAYAEIKDANAEVLVVSTDTVFSHKRWIETEKLLEGFGIQMVSDRKGDISDLFNVLNDESGNSERGTFIISPEGVVKSIEISTEPVGRSSDELVRKLHALEYVRTNPGQACPASWNSGQKVLKPGIDIAGMVAEHLDK